MTWTIDETVFDDAYNAADYILDNTDIEIYDEMLDDVYGEINIAGIVFDTSYALYKLDEISYHCGWIDYKDSLCQDMGYEMERMDDGEEIKFYGKTVRCNIEDELDAEVEVDL